MALQYSVDLTSTIKDNLRRYPDASVSKELLQNADDADGASRIAFLLDKRNYPTSKLRDEHLAPWQGPALWVFNDGVFDEKDLKSITKIGKSRKRHDETSTGRFGLGFCSVYNWTDVPSFISGDNLVWLDPQARFLPDELNICHQKLSALKLRQIKDWADSLVPYKEAMTWFQPKDKFSFDGSSQLRGTLFRLPLRTTTVASGISDTCPSVDQVESHLREFQNMSFVFLNRIKDLAVAVMEESGHVRDILQVQMFRRPLVLSDKMECDDLEEKIAYSSSEVSVQKTVDAVREDLQVFLSVSGECKEGRLRTLLEDAKTDNFAYPAPVGGVAILFKRGQNLLPRVPEGQDLLSCTLPLPIQTGLPFMVNGRFEVTSDRQSLEKLDVKFVRWNETMVEDLISFCLARAFSLLTDHLLHSEGSSSLEAAAVDLFCLWPSSHLKGSWQKILAYSFFKIVCSNGRERFLRGLARSNLRQRAELLSAACGPLNKCRIILTSHRLDDFCPVEFSGDARQETGIFVEVLDQSKTFSADFAPVIVMSRPQWDLLVEEGLKEEHSLSLITPTEVHRWLLQQDMEADSKAWAGLLCDHPQSSLLWVFLSLDRGSLASLLGKLQNTVPELLQGLLPTLWTAWSVLDYMPELEGLPLLLIQVEERKKTFMGQRKTWRSSSLSQARGSDTSPLQQKAEVVDGSYESFSKVQKRGGELSASTVQELVSVFSTFGAKFLCPRIDSKVWPSCKLQPHVVGLLTSLMATTCKPTGNMPTLEDASALLAFRHMVDTLTSSDFESRMSQAARRLPIFPFHSEENGCLTFAPLNSKCFLPPANSEIDPSLFPAQAVRLDLIPISSSHGELWNQKAVQFLKAIKVPVLSRADFFLAHVLAQMELKVDHPLPERLWNIASRQAVELLQTKEEFSGAHGLLKKKLANISFLSCGSGGSRFKPSQLFRREFLDIWGPDFTITADHPLSYLEPQLCTLGLNTTMSLEHLIACVKTPNLAFGRACALLKWIEQNVHELEKARRENAELWQTFVSIEWLPLEPALKGEAVPSSKRSRRSYGSVNSARPWHQRLVASGSFQILNRKLHMCEVGRTETCGEDSCPLMELFEWTIRPSTILQQLTALSKLAEPSAEACFECMKIFSTRYSTKQADWKDKAELFLKWTRSEPRKKWLWTGKMFGFRDGNCAALECEISSTLLPTISSELKELVPELYKYCNVKLEFSAADYFAIIGEEEKSARGSKLSPKKQQLVIQLLNLLSRLLRECPEPHASSTWLLSADGKFQEPSALFYNDAPWAEVSSETNLVHPDIMPTIAFRLGCRSRALYLREFAGMRGLTLLGEAQGQRVDLCEALRAIHEGYESVVGSSIFLELLQNAEDAGASSAEVCFSEKGFPLEDLLKTQSNTKFLEEFQGPALYFYNDSIFQEADWVGIQSVHASNKRSDGYKAGEHGIGFNSVYGITDFPIVMSNDRILFLDPHGDNLPEPCSTSSPGLLIKFLKNKALKKKKAFDFMFDSGLPVAKTSQNRPFKGSLFRLPLRTSHRASSSRISNQPCPPELMRQLLLDFGKEHLHKALLHLHNINALRISTIDSKGQYCLAYEICVKSKDHASYVNAFRMSCKSGSDLPRVQRGFRHSQIQAKVLLESSDGKKQQKQTSSWKTCYQTGVQAREIEGDRMTTPEWGAVSIEVGKDGLPASTQQSFNLFCRLPLPTTSQVPAHLEGAFRSDQFRRGLRGLRNEKMKENDRDARWNQLIFKHILAPSYAELVASFFSMVNLDASDGEVCSAVCRIYRSLPVDIAAEQESSWTNEVFAALAERQIFLTQTNRLASLSDVMFWSAKEVQLPLIEVLSFLGAPVLNKAVPECIKRRFASVLTGACRWLTPSLAVASISQSSKQLSCEQALLLLKYVLADSECASLALTKFKKLKQPILPLLDNSISVLPTKSDPPIFFTSSPEKAELVCFAKNRIFFAPDFPEKCLQQMVQAGIRSLGIADIRQLALQDAAFHPSEEWTRRLWNLFWEQSVSSCDIKKAVKPCIAESMQGLRILSVVVDEQSTCISDGKNNGDSMNLQLAILIRPSLTFSSDFKLLDPRLRVILRKLGCQVAHKDWDHVVRASSLCEEGWLNMPSFQGILSVLETIKSDPNLRETWKLVSDAEWLELRRFLADLLQAKDKSLPVHPALKALPFLQVLGDTSLRRLEDFASPPFVLPQCLEALVHFPLCLEEFVSPDYDDLLKDLKLLALLGIKRAIIDDAVKWIIPHLSTLDPKDRVGIQKIILESCEMPTFLTEMKIVTAALTSVPATELLAPGPCVAALFGKGKVPHSDLRSGKALQMLKRLGVKAVATACDVLAVAGRLAEQSPSEESKRDTTFVKFLERYHEKLPADVWPHLRQVPWLLCHLAGSKEKARAAPSSLIGAPYSRVCNLTASTALLELSHVLHKQLQIQKPSEKHVRQQLAALGPKDLKKPHVLSMVIACYGFLKNSKLQLPLDFPSVLARNIEGKEYFSRASQVCISGRGLEIYPYIVPISPTMLRFADWLQQQGVAAEPSEFQLTATLASLQERQTRDKSALSQAEIEFCLKAIPELTKKPETSLRFPLPSCQSVLMMPEELYYDDAPWTKDKVPDIKQTQLHGEVSNNVAQKAGVRGLRELLESCGVHEEGEPWSQQVDLVNRLRNLLKDYKADSVIREFMQNADDADASRIVFILDEKMSSSESLPKDSLKVLCTPSIVVINNSPMSDNDFNRISQVDFGGKSTERDKIGQFGLGFNACYNVTDTPFITSRQKLKVSTPLGGVFGSDLGKSYDLNKMEMFPDFIQPFQWLDSCGLPAKDRFGPTQSEHRTLFRLPLRSAASKLGEPVTVADALDMFRDAASLGAKNLLFLKSLQHLSFWRRDEQGHLELLAKISCKESRDAAFRCKLKTYLKNLSTSSSCEDLASKTEKINLEISFDKGQKTKETWIVHHRADSSFLRFQSGCGNGFTRRVSIGGVAACLHTSGPSCQESLAYCFLPIATERTGLPLEVHGAFEVSTGRLLEPDSKWNLFLAHQTIAPAYLALLLHLANEINDTTVARYAKLWPSQKPSNFLWLALLKKLYSLALESPHRLVPVCSTDNLAVAMAAFDVKTSYFAKDYLYDSPTLGYLLRNSERVAVRKIALALLFASKVVDDGDTLKLPCELSPSKLRQIIKDTQSTIDVKTATSESALELGAHPSLPSTEKEALDLVFQAVKDLRSQAECNGLCDDLILMPLLGGRVCALGDVFFHQGFKNLLPLGQHMFPASISLQTPRRRLLLERFLKPFSLCMILKYIEFTPVADREGSQYCSVSDTEGLLKLWLRDLWAFISNQQKTWKEGQSASLITLLEKYPLIPAQLELRLQRPANVNVKRAYSLAVKICFHNTKAEVPHLLLKLAPEVEVPWSLRELLAPPPSHGLCEAAKSLELLRQLGEELPAYWTTDHEKHGRLWNQKQALLNCFATMAVSHGTSLDEDTKRALKLLAIYPTPAGLAVSLSDKPAVFLADSKCCFSSNHRITLAASEQKHKVLYRLLGVSQLSYKDYFAEALDEILKETSKEQRKEKTFQLLDMIEKLFAAPSKSTGFEMETSDIALWLRTQKIVPVCDAESVLHFQRPQDFYSPSSNRFATIVAYFRLPCEPELSLSLKLVREVVESTTLEEKEKHQACLAFAGHLLTQLEDIDIRSREQVLQLRFIPGRWAPAKWPGAKIEDRLVCWKEMVSEDQHLACFSVRPTMHSSMKEFDLGKAKRFCRELILEDLVKHAKNIPQLAQGLALNASTIPSLVTPLLEELRLFFQLDPQKEQPGWAELESADWLPAGDEEDLKWVQPTSLLWNFPKDADHQLCRFFSPTMPFLKEYAPVLTSLGIHKELTLESALMLVKLKQDELTHPSVIKLLEFLDTLELEIEGREKSATRLPEIHKFLDEDYRVQEVSSLLINDRVELHNPRKRIKLSGFYLVPRTLHKLALSLGIPRLSKVLMEQVCEGIIEESSEDEALTSLLQSSQFKQGVQELWMWNKPGKMAFEHILENLSEALAPTVRTIGKLRTRFILTLHGSEDITTDGGDLGTLCLFDVKSRLIFLEKPFQPDNAVESLKCMARELNKHLFQGQLDCGLLQEMLSSVEDPDNIGPRLRKAGVPPLPESDIIEGNVLRPAHDDISLLDPSSTAIKVGDWVAWEDDERKAKRYARVLSKTGSGHFAKVKIDLGPLGKKDLFVDEVWAFIPNFHAAQDRGTAAQDSTRLEIVASGTESKFSSGDSFKHFERDASFQTTPESPKPVLTLEQKLEGARLEVLEILQLEFRLQQKAFRKLLFKWHPDKNPDDEKDCTQIFQQIKNWMEAPATVRCAGSPTSSSSSSSTYARSSTSSSSSSSTYARSSTSSSSSSYARSSSSSAPPRWDKFFNDFNRESSSSAPPPWDDFFNDFNREFNRRNFFNQKKRRPHVNKDMIWQEWFASSQYARCPLCHTMLSRNDLSWRAAHIIPHCRGGGVGPNLVPTCESCDVQCGQQNLFAFCQHAFPSSCLPLVLRVAVRSNPVAHTLEMLAGYLERYAAEEKLEYLAAVCRLQAQQNISVKTFLARYREQAQLKAEKEIEISHQPFMSYAV
eukprot:g46875.t1